MMPAVHISKAVQGWEKMNMAVTVFGDKCSNPVKTSRFTASLLPNCPGGLGKIKNML